MLGKKLSTKTEMTSLIWSTSNCIKHEPMIFTTNVVKGSCAEVDPTRTLASLHAVSYYSSIHTEAQKKITINMIKAQNPKTAI